MYERLAEICTAAGEDPAIKALLITGTGEKAFAAGTDIGQFRAFATPEDALAYEARIDRVLVAVETCPKPTIAAIAGACTGGGAAIAAVCDLRIAAANMRFGFPIARTVGNCLSISNYARLNTLARPGAHQGHHLHLPPDRGGGGAGDRPGQRDPAGRRRPGDPAPMRWRSLSQHRHR